MKKLIDFILYLFKRSIQDDLFGLAAQMAYYFLLSLFPSLIFIVTLIPFLHVNNQQLLSFVNRLGPSSVSEVIIIALNQVLSSPNLGLLSLGFIGAMWSASSGINAVIVTLDHAYDVKVRRTFFKQRALSLLLTIGMIVVLLVTLALPVFGKQVGLWLFSQFGGEDKFPIIWHFIRWGISVAILIGVFTSIFWIGPNIKIKCRKAVPGAMFTSIGWLVASYGFAYYVDHFSNYTKALGSIGGTIILILWFYITGIFIILGGELNAYIKKFEKGSCN